MSCGLPVVTTDCGGMGEAVTNGVEGFLTPPWDVQAQAQALSRLALDPLLRTRMGEAGRRRVQKDFNLESQVAQYIRLFDEAAKSVRRKQ